MANEHRSTTGAPSPMRVMFCREMLADSESFSPSAMKPGQVAADWLAAGLNIEIVAPRRATPMMIAQAHAKAYVARVLLLNEPNGFGNFSPAVARSLPWTVGAMVDATLAAMRDGRPTAALVSGAHHACYDRGGGYCSFNNLIVAAFEARKAGAKRVGILDADFHFGNGTEDIIKRLNLKWISHDTVGAFYRDASQAEMFLAALPGIMRQRFFDSDVLLFQAGADQYIEDELGGFLTMKQLAARDRIVFETARAMNLPVSWSLAGGYARDENGEITPVLAIHRQTAEAALRATARPKLVSSR